MHPDARTTRLQPLCKPRYSTRFPFIPSDRGLPHTDARSATTLDFSRPAQRSLAITACRLAESPKRPVCLEGSDGFVTSTAAPIATGWSDPVAGWELHPLKSQHLFTAHTRSDPTRLQTPHACIQSPGHSQDGPSNHAPTRSVCTAAAVASLRARFSHSCGINVALASLGLCARTCERYHGLFSPGSRPTASSQTLSASPTGLRARWACGLVVLGTTKC